jgi:hypothetical protein
MWVHFDSQPIARPAERVDFEAGPDPALHEPLGRERLRAQRIGDEQLGTALLGHEAL